MTSSRNTTCIKVLVTETINEVQSSDSVSTASHHRRCSKEEKEKSRRFNKESIKSDKTVDKGKPISCNIKSKKVVNIVTTRRQKNNESNYKNHIAKYYSNYTLKNNFVPPLTLHKSNKYMIHDDNNSILGNPLYPPSTPFAFSVLYRTLSYSQMNYHGRRFREADYSNSTKASQLDKQKAWSLRSWQYTPLGKSIRKRYVGPRSCIFKIMSYNVLAQELLEEHSYLYKYHNPNAIVWEQRWFTLLEELKYHNADILCLQEVQESHINNYYSKLHALGYNSIFKQRTGERTDGCAIYYKHSVFKLIEYTTVEFNQSSIPVLNRDNVAIIAKFSPLNNETNEFVVATTHLLYNPRREDVRLAQTQVLLSELDRIAYKPNSGNGNHHLPIILTGDFNLLPKSVVYELLTKGYLKYEDLPNRSLSMQNTTFANVTGKQLLPAFLKITDQCQHADLVEHRLKNADLNREDELKLIQLHHSERQFINKSLKSYDSSLYSTGTLTHHFILNSVYRHNYGNNTEATTYQDEWVTVDYIFYSTKLDEQTGNKLDGKLKLISRYKLPITQDLQNVKIPNFALGSDHFLLLVTFQLDP